MRLIIALLLTIVAACASRKASLPDLTGKSQAEMEIILDRLASECGLPADFFEFEAGDLRMRPKPTEKYDRVDCALAKIRRIRGLPSLGFVGNEAHVGNGQ